MTSNIFSKTTPSQPAYSSYLHPRACSQIRSLSHSTKLTLKPTKKKKKPKPSSNKSCVTHTSWTPSADTSSFFQTYRRIPSINTTEWVTPVRNTPSWCLCQSGRWSFKRTRIKEYRGRWRRISRHSIIGLYLPGCWQLPKEPSKCNQVILIRHVNWMKRDVLGFQVKSEEVQKIFGVFSLYNITDLFLVILLYPAIFHKREHAILVD